MNETGSVLVIILIGLSILVFFLIDILYYDILWNQNLISMESEEEIDFLLESGYALSISVLNNVNPDNSYDLGTKWINYQGLTYEIEFTQQTIEDDIIYINISIPSLTKKRINIIYNLPNKSVMSWREVFD